jgi:hypothetical protein
MDFIQMTATRVRGSAYMAESSTPGTAGSTSALMAHSKPLPSSSPTEDVSGPLSSGKQTPDLSLRAGMLTKPSQRLDL